MSKKKRETVRRMLKKRLSNAKKFLMDHENISDSFLAYGYDPKKFMNDQSIINAKTDIAECEFLLAKLDEFQKPKTKKEELL